MLDASETGTGFLVPVFVSVSRALSVLAGVTVQPINKNKKLSIMCNISTTISYQSVISDSSTDVILEARRGGLDLGTYDLDLGPGLEGPGLGLGVKSCTDNVLASP